MNKKLIASSVLTLLALPSVILALNFIPPSGNANFSPALLVVSILNFIWPLVVGATIISFLAAGFLYMTAQGEPTKVSAANKAVIGGVVGVVVILLAFSIINVVQIGTGLF